MISKSELFRQHHFLQLLKTFDLSRGPIDVFVNLYFRHHPQLGSKDRLFIVERIYKYFRWKLLVDTLCEEGQDLLEVLEGEIPSRPDLPPHIRVSFPEALFTLLQKAFHDQTEAICVASNTPAPITIRVNPLKTTKTELQKRFREKEIVAEEIDGVPFALKLNRRVNLTAFQEFKDGFFEIQDAASQKVAELIAAHPGDQVLDFCAGAGGKTLAFASKLEGKGQIFLHDVRKSSLDEAKKRLRRAGVQNIQIISSDEASKLSRLKGKMDWVLLDVPCSGTGTLRRNPDLKWKFSEERLKNLIQEQRAIIREGVSYLKAGGSLVYATCSILSEENEGQIAWILDNFPLKVDGNLFTSLPSRDMDGLFATRLIY